MAQLASLRGGRRDGCGGTGVAGERREVGVGGRLASRRRAPLRNRLPKPGFISAKGGHDAPGYQRGGKRRRGLYGPNFRVPPWRSAAAR